MIPEQIRKLKVALVDDFLTVDGGAQRVLRVLHDIWPDAPVYTVTYFPEKFNPPLEGWDIRQSFVSKLPFRRKLENQYKIFYQMAVEKFDFSDYDLVLSQTYAGYAKGVIVPPEIPHVSYVHNVPRFLWNLPTSRHDTLNPLYKKVILPPLEHVWRIWDRQSADRPDVLMANSETVKGRVKKFYKRDSTVLNPPVEVEALVKFESKNGSKLDDYFVYFGRLEEYKRVDLAIKAVDAFGGKLKIIGSGSCEEALKGLVEDCNNSENFEFLGRLSDEARNEVVANSKALIFPTPDEDFGIVPVEANALGVPVVGFNSGGIKETIINGKTGILVDDVSVDSLVDGLNQLDDSSISSEECKSQAQNFSVDVFKSRLAKLLSNVL